MRYNVESHRGIVYREVDGIELRLDLHRPVAAEPMPVVVYFHGGGFVVGDRADHEAGRALELAARGIAVATVQYRFSAQARFPAQLEDARAAVDWLRSEGPEYRLRVDRIGAWGASAGAHIAALLGLGVPAAGKAPSVDAVVTWFPVLDLAARFGGGPLDGKLVPPVSERAWLGVEDFDPSDPRQRAASPLLNVSGGAAPFLVMTGDRDRIVDAAQSARFHDALVTSGATSTLVVVGGAGHEDPAFEFAHHIGMVVEFFSAQLSDRTPHG